MGFEQTDRIRDSVFPLVEVGQGVDSSVAFLGLLGTGFVIGGRGFALTAAHVLDGVDSARALFIETDGSWAALPLLSVERHRTEDLAVVRLSGEEWGSIFDLEPTDVRASFEYATWGYPKDVLHEAVVDGRAVPRPDLVFTSGHVRRRLRGIKIPKVRGSLLAELTMPAGSGFSGAPILGPPGNRRWSVVGVYIAERLSDDVHVGYAVLTEAFGSWAPDIVGRSLRDEARETRRLPSGDA